jgi:hypothetical protein
MGTPIFWECTPKYIETSGVDHWSLHESWSELTHTPIFLECMDFPAKKGVHAVDDWSTFSLPQKLRYKVYIQLNILPPGQ